MKSILNVILILLFSACSKTSPSRKLEVFRANLTVNDLDGGAIIWIKNVATNQIQKYEFTTPPFEVLLEDGTWSIGIVGFLGPGPWSGTTQCGGVENLTLGPTDLNVKIQVSTTCSSAAHQEMIGTKIAKFDVSKWDQTVWAP